MFRSGENKNPGICELVAINVNDVTSLVLLDPITRRIAVKTGVRWQRIGYSAYQPQIARTINQRLEGPSVDISATYKLSGFDADVLKDIQKSVSSRYIFCYKERDGVWKAMGTKENGCRLSSNYKSELTSLDNSIDLELRGGDDIYLIVGESPDIPVCNYLLEGVNLCGGEFVIGTLRLMAGFDEYLDTEFPEGLEVNDFKVSLGSFVAPQILNAGISSSSVQVTSALQVLEIIRDAFNAAAAAPGTLWARAEILDGELKFFSNQCSTPSLQAPFTLTINSEPIHEEFTWGDAVELIVAGSNINVNTSSSFLQIGVHSTTALTLWVNINGVWVDVSSQVNDGVWLRMNTRDVITLYQIRDGDTVVSSGPVPSFGCE